jgi:hypothetical protein
MTTPFSSLVQDIITGVQEGPEAIVRRVREDGGRSIDQRRSYVGYPEKYFHEILGWSLTDKQEEALRLIEDNDKVLIPAGNNTGKTFMLGGYAIYRMDAVAAMFDEDRSLEEQGAQILLPGPDHGTIFSTIYASILEHALRAEGRGYKMPGDRSERSVHWRVRPRWHMEAFAPSFRIGQEIAHSASGRHHRNQIAVIEEGQGVEEALWKAVEGMCSSDGNKIISAFNPSEPSGPTYQRSLRGGYVIFHMSAFDHPNVKRRMVAVPDAISFRVIDARVETECRDRGLLGSVVPDTDHGDFVYALPPSLETADDSGIRGDGHLGHPDGELRVYRPSPQFEAQVLGTWPRTSDTGLFDPGAWDKSVKRWLLQEDPSTPPDSIGLDVARFGEDETCACPKWGGSTNSLIRDHAEAMREKDNKKLQYMRDYERIRVGEIITIPKGDGPSVALKTHQLYPHSPINVDESGVGASVLDHLQHVLTVQAFGVSFAKAVDETLPGEVICENTRAAMYVRAATLIRLGLIDVPNDPLLREEVMAHEIVHSSRVVKLSAYKRERKPSVRILEKDEIRKKINRSPDRADAFVLSLFDPDAGGNWELF